ncbi:unnamed protein product, partial [Chrysoparadoxa australica]
MDQEPNLKVLSTLMKAYMVALPYQNLTMLLPSRQHRPPTPAELKQDVLMGFGGPCAVLNSVFAALLHSLGYDVQLAAGSIQQPGCHIVILVRLAGELWWVDCGNAKPYFKPVALGDETSKTVGTWSYKVAVDSREGSYKVLHSTKGGDWVGGYAFQARPSYHLVDFMPMIRRSRVDPGFSRFLTCVKVVWLND